MSSNINIVLVNTSHSGNIGSTARAMKTMGLKNLVLVSPKNFPSDIANAQADIAQAENIYKHDQTLAQGSAKWVTTFSATCRPVITYLFLFSYLTAKTITIWQAYTSGVELHENLHIIYSDFDEGMVSCIIAFWFGQRAMAKR